MTEQQELHPAPQLPIEPPARRQPALRAGTVLGGAAILLAIGLTAGLYLYSQENALAQHAKLNELEQQLSRTNDKLTWRENKEKQQLTLMAQAQQQLHDDMSKLQNRVLNLDDKRPNDWLLAESDFLVRMAGRKLWFEHDIVSAITLLSNADERIAALNDPNLMPIREALANDIAQLNTLPRIDREGLTLRLAALSDQIELLPLAIMHIADKNPTADQVVTDNPSQWEQNLKANLLKFTENFVTIRRRDGMVEALLSPQQEVFLRENIKTKLLLAQLAIYRQQQDLYEDSLDKARRWLTQYFDSNHSGTQYILNELERLKGEQIQFDYPQQLSSQHVLEQALTERLHRIMANS